MLKVQLFSDVLDWRLATTESISRRSGSFGAVVDLLDVGLFALLRVEEFERRLDVIDVQTQRPVQPG